MARFQPMMFISLSQVDQNGIVYGPKTDRKPGRNEIFTDIYCADTARFRSVFCRFFQLYGYNTVGCSILY